MGTSVNEVNPGKEQEVLDLEEKEWKEESDSEDIRPWHRGFKCCSLSIGSGIIALFGLGQLNDRLYFPGRLMNWNLLNSTEVSVNRASLAASFSSSWSVIGGESSATERVLLRSER